MNFKNIYKEAEENLRLALLSLWAPGSHPMRPAIEELFEREPLLSEPVFQSTFGWEPVTNDAWRKAFLPEVIQKLKIGDAYPPYTHQAKSWRALHEGNSIVVTSGTGSGKTECFMYPVINDLYERNKAGRQEAIEAIFLYPLNALMEDQKARLSKYCETTGLHFAVYNGSTQEYREPETKLPCEVATRQAIRERATRPEILLTNPSMLEYILVRQADQTMLQESRGKLRWIVIDEAHSYSGSAAVELSYQIKRILNAFGETADDVRFACTSATIGDAEGTQQLRDFMATITGQKPEKIQIIGGRRLLPKLADRELDEALKAQGLDIKVKRVKRLREKINAEPGMTLHNIWSELCPNQPYQRDTALDMTDRLCEMKTGDAPVLSLRGHFFMRSISGLYACGNADCDEANTTQPLFGRLTTYKHTLCPTCGAPLLEVVQCKRCGSFILTGEHDNDRRLMPTDDRYTTTDILSRLDDDDPDSPDDDDPEPTVGNNNDTFFLLPYCKQTYFTPVHQGVDDTVDLVHENGTHTFTLRADEQGAWVEVRNEKRTPCCPSCGKAAMGKHGLTLKHFRTTIAFINQTISPVILRECRQGENPWGKYIAFTDSRQGTAISAKTFNIDVERTYFRECIVETLGKEPEIPDWIGEDEEMRKKFLAQLPGIALEKIVEEGCAYSPKLYRHMEGEKADNPRPYKAALLRQNLASKPLNESSAENMGLLKLEYSALKKAKLPNSLIDYMDKYGGKITDKDWRDFLTLTLDYFFRANNIIQPLKEGERAFVRDGHLGAPCLPPDSTEQSNGRKRWPTVNAAHPTRLVLLLCAGLGIHTEEQLAAREKDVNDILRDAWNTLVSLHLLTRVSPEQEGGYNDTRYYPDAQNVGCYYLDLSPSSTVAQVKRPEQVWECPVSHRLLDTLFLGYSPYIIGVPCEKLFARYKVTTEPLTPDNFEQALKARGLWSDRYKYTFQKLPTYVAAEHSAQQDRKLLRNYTDLFKQKNHAINVLHCSTTMEMGVDIGDIDVVLMDTIPPTAANYLQRVGRAGRMGQTKALAFSLCNNTPVGKAAFNNPMWALTATNRMSPVQESHIIVQRHINSYFFHLFLCDQNTGMLATQKVGDFMQDTYPGFIKYLQEITTNKKCEQAFHQVFGQKQAYTIEQTIEAIEAIKRNYDDVAGELNAAYEQYKTDKTAERRKIAISLQLRNLESKNVLTFLSESRFLPNANMPTGVVTFDFTDYKTMIDLNKLYDQKDKLRLEIDGETDALHKKGKEKELGDTAAKIERLKKATSATRDIRTALNEYAPGQTVVVNEKNYVSAGVMLRGVYNENTDKHGIYKCTKCGHTEYLNILDENRTCPKCNSPYHSIIDSDSSRYTLAYAPIGFRTLQTKESTREEQTERHYYDIQPVLLKTDWTKAQAINMCEAISSGERGKILYYNAGRGYGFALCKRCGRAAVETLPVATEATLPSTLRPHHKTLWGNDCDAAVSDIARHVVFTGEHPTCYTVLRFYKDALQNEMENDEALAFSLGVVIKRALAQIEGVDEGEIDFGIKQERMDGQDAWVLYVYDTAKGGCGYSLRLQSPTALQEVLTRALHMLEDTECQCHIDGGACAQCLIDQRNWRYAKLLSKQKALDWLRQQALAQQDLPQEVKDASPQAQPTGLMMKRILRYAIEEDPQVTAITLVASDTAGDYNITDWLSRHTEMGHLIHCALNKGIKVRLAIEYHPEAHTRIASTQPFIGLKGRFTDCEDVTFIQDMGPLKTYAIIETNASTSHYFTNDPSSLPLSDQWGESPAVYMDHCEPVFQPEAEPEYKEMPGRIVQDRFYRNKTPFELKAFYSKVLKPTLLNEQYSEEINTVLQGQKVNLAFGDGYVCNALSCLMLTYLIKELKETYNLTIESLVLRIQSKKEWNNNPPYGYITHDFANKEERDAYLRGLLTEKLSVEPIFSEDESDHFRELEISTEGHGTVEIRFDHGISGPFCSDARYGGTLNGLTRAKLKKDCALYYIVIQKPEP